MSGSADIARRGERAPSAPSSFAVLLVSAAEYRIDGSFRYVGDGLPRPGDLIAVADERSGIERQARVRRVGAGERYPVHATELTKLSPERSVGPLERARRKSAEASARVLAARRGWLRRRRRKLASERPGEFRPPPARE